jgi:hypothetical protein
MLVVEVVKPQLPPSTVRQVNTVLQQWATDFPTNDAASASIWADHIRCTSTSAFCPFQHMDNVQREGR